MAGNRKRYAAEFKARVALEALRGELTTAQLATKYGVHQTMVSDWKCHAMEGLSSLFTGEMEGKTPSAKERSRTAREDRPIGGGTGPFWRKPPVDDGGPEAATATPTNGLPIVRQCELVFTRRPHSGLDGRTPDEAYAAIGAGVDGGTRLAARREPEPSLAKPPNCPMKRGRLTACWTVLRQPQACPCGGDVGRGRHRKH
jgi:transposase